MRDKDKNKFFLISSIVLVIGLGVSTAAMSINNEMFNSKFKDVNEAIKNDEILEEFNNFEVDENIVKGIYGKSGLGRNLYFYKIGTGHKSLIINFGIHGFEDAWPKDGYELSKISEYIIHRLSKEYDGLDVKEWSIYIIPSSNPDGLLDGYTNNGPGRCQVTNKIDLNRNFPIEFETNKNYRNYNGEEPLSVPESKELANLVFNINKESDRLVLLDVHGWLNETIGDSDVGKYFDIEFGFKNRELNNNFKGYLIAYAKALGAGVSLVELPKPNNKEDIERENYKEKLYNGIVALLKNYDR
ncbi:M14 family zinc carboxypeptidase [Clostridium massiliamazoniense]|uniref:M14 family zinc carboxypeptidase n=1 Tax=Clostridium massiliamazoniense TaxID=1347366 RepID=UPI0006D82AD0|nr:M14 family zinc carboxypeptidase [Clostridium massiliamazoniense]